MRSVIATKNKLMSWHCLDTAATVESLRSNRTQGLTQHQVDEYRQQYGLNELEAATGRSSWEILIDQFRNIMLLMLIAVAIVTAALNFLFWRC